MNMLFQLRRPILACVPALLALVATAHGQYPYGGGYYPPNPYGFGRGSQAAGQAELVKAAGQLGIDQEKARVERETANQAKLVTQKKAFDQMLYERSMTPTYAESLPYIDTRIVSRMINAPQPSEISQGKTLNAFAPYVVKLAETGVQGPPIPVNQMALQRINVTTGQNGPKIGVLKSMPVRWPMGLRGPLQKEFDPLLQSAVSQATTDSLGPMLYKQVLAKLSGIENDFLRRFQTEEISTGEYLTATLFLENLKPAVRALGQPDVSRLLDGSVAAKGNNVPELSSNMTFNGFSFAPGNPGSEAAYKTLHDSYVGYIRTAQASTGMQPQYRPPVPNINGR